jgi:hypothetical protein
MPPAIVTVPVTTAAETEWRMMKNAAIPAASAAIRIHSGAAASDPGAKTISLPTIAVSSGADPRCNVRPRLLSRAGCGR